MIIRDSLTIENVDAANAIGNDRCRLILLNLIQADRSLAELSGLVNLKLNLAHYYIKKLLSLKLVKVSAVRVRKGGPIKLYRAVAREFVVPSHVAAVPFEPLYSRLRDALERVWAANIAGVRYWHDGDRPQMRLLKSSNSRATEMELWAEIELPKERAAALAQELAEVVRKYAVSSGKSKRRYLVHSAIVQN